MKKQLVLIVLIALPLLCLCSCGQAQSSKKESIPPEPVDKPINVFVLAGQSNMEGNTQFDDGEGKHYLQDAFDEMGIDESVDDLKNEGIPEVQTSYYSRSTNKLLYRTSF